MMNPEDNECKACSLASYYEEEESKTPKEEKTNDDNATEEC